MSQAAANPLPSSSTEHGPPPAGCDTMPPMQAKRGKLFTLTIAALGLAVLVAAGLSMKEAAVERWYLSRLEAPSFTERFRAARMLGALRSTRAIPGLVALLRECNEQNAEATKAAEPWSTPGLLLVGILGEIGPPAVPALAQALRETRGSREQWRRQACSALGEINAEEAIPPLIELVEDEDPCVRWIALKMLGAMGPRAHSAVPALTRSIAAHGERKSTLRDAAANALKTILATGNAGPPR